MTNEWVAPESNRTVAGTEFTRNVPSTTSGASRASSALIWFRRPFAIAAFTQGAVLLIGPSRLGAGALGRGTFLLGLGHSLE